MFGKNKTHKKRKHLRIDTLIGEQTFISGDISFSGGLRVDGRINGNIYAENDDHATLSLSEKGVIDGEIRVPYLVINGQVNGNIYASQHLELAAAARISGNVFYQTIEIAVGSEINGQMIHISPEQAETLQIVQSETEDNDSLQLEKQG